MPLTKTSEPLLKRVFGRTPRTSPFAPPKPADPPPKGFEQAKAPSARAAKLTRVGFRCLIALVAVLLVINVVQNARAANRAASAPAAAELNADDARLAASTFTSDYLSHDPAASPLAGQEALKRALAPGGDAAKMAFTGTASLSTDVVVPGAVTQLDATHAVVAVQARVSIGMPDHVEGAPQPATLTPPPSVGRSANRTVLPDGYHVISTQWLSLSVPVVQTDSGLLVDVTGPVFSADPAPSLPPAGLESDSTATEKTRDWARTLFTSYALGSTQTAYLSAPGVVLTGLVGAVTVADVQTWRLSAPGPDNLRTGQARIGWTFAPAADLAVAQSYTVTVQTDDSRWYVTSLGASATPTN